MQTNHTTVFHHHAAEALSTCRSQASASDTSLAVSPSNIRNCGWQLFRIRQLQNYIRDQLHRRWRFEQFVLCSLFEPCVIVQSRVAKIFFNIVTISLSTVVVTEFLRSVKILIEYFVR